jgi:esterase
VNISFVKSVRLVSRVLALAAVVSVGLGVSSAGAEPQWKIPDGVKYTEVNGYDMAYQESGSGAPLVLVHGALTDYRTWAAVAPELAKHYHVYIVALRHYYPEKWDGKGNDFSYEQHASDVAEFIKKLKLGKVHLLGHSRGGGVVVNVAKQNPEVIKTLILADAVGFESLLPNTEADQKLANASRDRIETLKKNLAAGNNDLAGQMFVDSLSGPGAWAKRSPEVKQRLFDNLGTASQMGTTPPTTCDQVRKFDFPVLVLHGENSPKNFSAMSAAMRQCKHVADPIIIPNAAHNMFVDNPPVFEAAVLGFLAHDQ